MSEPTKRRHTEDIAIEIGNKKKRLFLVPKSKASGIIKILEDYEVQDSIQWRDVFKEEINETGEPAIILKGSRNKENMTQKELAVALQVTQSNIAEMESGKRPITKKTAQKLAKIFRCNYRIFL